MPDIFLYPGSSIFRPNSEEDDVVLLDPNKYHQPYFYNGEHGESVKFTPNELGVPGIKLAKGTKQPKKTQEQIEKEVLVLLAEQRYAEELLVREEEDRARRAARIVERAQGRLKKLQSGVSVWKTDAEERMRDGIIAKNTAEKRRRQELEDEERLKRKVKMARIRAKRKV